MQIFATDAPPVITPPALTGSQVITRTIRTYDGQTWQVHIAGPGRRPGETFGHRQMSAHEMMEHEKDTSRLMGRHPFGGPKSVSSPP